MKYLTITLIVLLTFTVSLGGSVEELSAKETITITENGNPGAVIVIGRDASPSEEHGARELQTFIEVISGAFLPIFRENEKFSGPMILVGKSEKLTKIDKSIDFKKLGDEGFVMKTLNGNLILAGGRLRGSMYACYTFLEEKLGCRWYTSTVSHIPAIPTITVSDMDETQIPDFEYREPFWKDAFDADWAARNKCNSTWAELDVQRGGKINWPGGHNFFPYIPPAKWFESHPEYYSFTEGQRRCVRTQLCLTNPEVMKIMTRVVLDKMKAQPDDVLFEVSQNDGPGGWCDCGACKTVHEEEDAYSGTLVPFINAIGERTEKRYPKKYITTLIYSYTLKAPKYAKPRSNVVIRLCISGCGGHPLQTCPTNQGIRDLMEDWAPRTNKMFIWDYVTGFRHYLLPYPGLLALDHDIRWMKENGVDGVFLQGCYETQRGAFAELYAYIHSKLLWNSSRDMQELIDEFLTAYFGRAAKPIKAYIDMLHAKVESDSLHFFMIEPHEGFLERDILAKADSYFDEAERLAGSQEIARRVAQWRLSLRYAKLSRPIVHERDGDFYKPLPHEAQYTDLVELERFIRDCVEHRVEYLSEGDRYEHRYNMMKANNSTHRIVSLENPHIKVEFIPSIGGKIVQITEKKSGTELLGPAVIKERYYPGTGGYREQPAQMEPFDYTLHNDNSSQKIIIKGFVPFRQTHNAFYMTQNITLPDDKPEIIFSTTLKVLTEIDRTLRLTALPYFAFGKIEDMKIGVKNAEGKFSVVASGSQNSEEEISERLWGKSIAPGEWCLINTASNIGIIDSFKPEELDFCSYQINPQKNRAVLSLEGIRGSLEIGDVLTLQHKYTILNDAESILQQQ